MLKGLNEYIYIYTRCSQCKAKERVFAREQRRKGEAVDLLYNFSAPFGRLKRKG